jgi:hypothetical protein
MGLQLRALRPPLPPSRFVEPARQILGTDQLYIQRAKINARWRSPAKAWQWH